MAEEKEEVQNLSNDSNSEESPEVTSEDTETQETTETELDLENLTDEQLDAIKDPAAREMAANLRKGFNKKMKSLSDSEKQLAERAKTVAWAEQIHELYSQDPNLAVSEMKHLVSQMEQALGTTDSRTQSGSKDYQLSNEEKEIQELFEGGTEQEKFILSAIGALSTEVQNMAKTMRSSQAAQSAVQIEKDLVELHEKYGDFDDDMLLKTAYDNGLSDLEKAYKVAYFDQAVSLGEKKTKSRLEAKTDLEEDILTNREPQDTKKLDSVLDMFRQAQKDVNKKSRS
jgi:hypothetical protein